jgi:GLPGLI family protein
MKNYILIILFLFSSTILLQAQMFFAYGRDYGSRIVVDECRYSITYTFKFANDTVNKNTYYDKKRLEIGDKYSHYYSRFGYMIDSVWYNVKSKRENKDGSDGINPKKEAGLKADEKPMFEDVYVNYPETGLLTVLTRFGDTEYLYEEPVPKFEWNLQSDTTTIFGYKCIKATTMFRGRAYNVWFTPFIPIRHGPWKFNGLPGLILQAADTKGYFEWKVIEIGKFQNVKIYFYNFKKTEMQMTTRENVMKLQNKRWQDPIGLTFAITSMKSITIVNNGKQKRYERGTLSDFKRPYIPILELE